jgi:hypothetical protein
VVLAGEAIRAYTEHSYRDPGPLAWLDRLRKLSTGSLAHELEETFGGDQEADHHWRTQVVPQRRKTRTRILSVTRSGVHEATDDTITYTVTYLTSVRVQGSDWTTPTEPLSQFVTLTKQGATWRVAEIVPTSDHE